MTETYNFNVNSPSECTSADLADFVKMVESEGEVISGLERRVIERGYKLVFVRSQDALAAVGALKTPYSTYRSHVFKKAKTLSKPEDYALELGWIVVSPKARKNGLAGQLTDKLLQQIAESNVFATVRTDNEGMQRCLRSRGFARSGEPYPSENRKANLELFIR